jgi:voltage-gated potassium channel Kch
MEPALAPDPNATPPAVDGPVPWQERMREVSLTVLLACLFLLTFVVTPLVGLGVVGKLAAGVIWALLGVVSVLVVSGHRAAVAVILAATAVGLATAIIDRPTVLSAVLARGSTAVSLAALGGVIGRAAFGPGRVTWHRVQGAVALYLIIGLLFAHIYGVLIVLAPDAFANLPPGLSAHAVFYRGRLLYFSLVTLTSVGYGDIVPLHPVAYSLVTLEALIGQLFPAILLARLVSLELEGRRPLR